MQFKKTGDISITMCENLKELNIELENIDNKLNTLLSTLNSSENITFGNLAVISADVNINEHKAILSVKKINLIEAENTIGEVERLTIGNFNFDNSFILNYKQTETKTQFTIAINNLSYINNDNESFNIAIWEKPQQLNRLNSYIKDNVNATFLLFTLYEINFTLMCKKDKLFLVADRELEEKEFLKYIRGIKLALGFLMCDFMGGTDTFLLTDENITEIENFKIFNLVDEQNLNFNIMIDSLPIVGAKYQNELNIPTKLSNEQFVNLCQLIIENPQVETAIHYIAQSANLSVEHKLTFLAVALEALTGYIGDNITSERQQVTNSSVSINRLLPPSEFKKLQNTYEKMLDDYKFNSNMNEQEINNIKATLKGKFQNRKSNRDSLSQPFELYNIPLSSDDIDMLAKRNRLLHGKPFDYNNDIQNDIQIFLNQAYTYYHLLYVLLLKIIGYEGVIFNLKTWEHILHLNNNLTGREITVEENNNTVDLFLEI